MVILWRWILISWLPYSTDTYFLDFEFVLCHIAWKFIALLHFLMKRYKMLKISVIFPILKIMALNQTSVPHNFNAYMNIEVWHRAGIRIIWNTLFLIVLCKGSKRNFATNSNFIHDYIHHRYDDVNASKILSVNLDAFIRIFFDILHEYLTSFTCAVFVFSQPNDFNHSMDGRRVPHSKTCQFYD